MNRLPGELVWLVACELSFASAFALRCTVRGLPASERLERVAWNRRLARGAEAADWLFVRGAYGFVRCTFDDAKVLAREGALNVLRYVATTRDSESAWYRVHWQAVAPQTYCAHMRFQLAEEAACGGHLHVLQWLNDRAPLDGVAFLLTIEAAREGHIPVLRWLRHLYLSRGWRGRWDEHIFTAAVVGEQYKVIEWARAQDPPGQWDSRVCKYAARHDRFEMLKWLRAQDPPAPWDVTVGQEAALRGDLTMLEWIQARAPLP